MKKIILLFGLLAIAFLTACLEPDYVPDRSSNATSSLADSNDNGQDIESSDTSSVLPTPLFIDGSINSDYVELVRKLLDDDSAEVTSPEEGSVFIKTGIDYSDTESFILNCSAVSASIISDPQATMIVIQFDGGIIMTNWQGELSTLNTTLYVNEDEPLKEDLKTAYYGNAIFNNYDMDKRIDEFLGK